jgi:hypothetical protein
MVACEHGSPLVLGTVTMAVEKLSDKQYVVLLLRLLVDADGKIVYGDAGGPEEHNPEGERWVHFHGPAGLLGAVEEWLAARRERPA